MALSAFRAPHAASVGTGLGCEAFRHFTVHHLPRYRFVLKKATEDGPSGVVHRFSHRRFSQLRTANVAHDDQIHRFLSADPMLYAGNLYVDWRFWHGDSVLVGSGACADAPQCGAVDSDTSAVLRSCYHRIERGHLDEVDGDFIAVRLAVLDDVTPQALIAAPVQFFDGRNNNWLNPPDETQHL